MTLEKSITTEEYIVAQLVKIQKTYPLGFTELVANARQGKKLGDSGNSAIFLTSWRSIFNKVTDLPEPVKRVIRQRVRGRGNQTYILISDNTPKPEPEVTQNNEQQTKTQ